MLVYGGGGGIRTFVAITRKHAFQACRLNRSHISPIRSLIKHKQKKVKIEKIL